MRAAFIPLVTLALTDGAAAEPLPIADLIGATITLSSTQDQRVRRGPREFQIKSRRDFTILVRSADAVQVKVVNSVQGPFGRRENSPRTAVFELGRERQVPTAGGGTAMWSYEDGAFIFMRTFREGALRLAVTVVRTDGQLTCSVTEAFAREEGKGAIVLNSPIDGAPVRIVDAKHSASSCKVTEAG